MMIMRFIRHDNISKCGSADLPLCFKKKVIMRNKVLLIVITLGMALTSHAQTFTDHVKQQQKGKGTMTVTQSKEIEDLVNGKPATSSESKSTAPEKSIAKPGQPVKKVAAGTPVNGESKKGTTPDPSDAKRTHEKEKDTAVVRENVRNVEANKAEELRREREARRAAEERNKENGGKTDDEMSVPTVDMRRKVMRGSRKITGYRVQAFAGGNTRNDKQRAQSIGNAIKMKFPDQPVYVHFYSPRWICRVGNFRSYQEAQRVLRQVKAMGYKAATIVKGQITVQY
jgi:type IV secretory pathway VirB10-like protein